MLRCLREERYRRDIFAVPEVWLCRMVVFTSNYRHNNCFFLMMPLIENINLQLIVLLQTQLVRVIIPEPRTCSFRGACMK